MSLRGAIRVIHPFPVIVVVGTSAALLATVSPHPPGLGVLIRAALVVLLTQIPVGALNDVIDRNVDAVHQPDKPIPSGDVTVAAAIGMTAVALLLLIPAALTFGPISLVIILIATGGGIVYDLFLKPTPFSFLGYLIGFIGLMTWIWHVAGALNSSLLLLYPFAACLVVAAHLAQSYPDIELDRAAGASGLAVSLGPGGTRRVLFALYAMQVAVVVAAALLRAPVALVPAAVSLYLAARARMHADTSRADRLVLFQFFAPALALLGLAAVLALVQ